MENLTFTINGKSVTPAQYNGKVRQFSITVDEPEDSGGTDTAPMPVEYILAGFAGCLNVVINMIAKEMGITIKNLEININGSINPEMLLGISKKERAGFKSLNVHLKIDSDASEVAVKQLTDAVKERCPVNDIISNPTPVYFSTSV